jgi:hypothetical protein
VVAEQRLVLRPSFARRRLLWDNLKEGDKNKSDLQLAVDTIGGTPQGTLVHRFIAHSTYPEAAEERLIQSVFFHH